MRIPSAYGTLGQLVPTVQPAVMPSINAGMEVPNALGTLATSLGNYGDTLNSIDMAQKEFNLKQKQAADESAFKTNVVNSKDVLTQSVDEIAKQQVVNEQDASGNWTQRPATPADRRADLSTIQGNIVDKLTQGVSPRIVQEYQPTIQQELIHSNNQLAKSEMATEIMRLNKDVLEINNGLPAEIEEFAKQPTEDARKNYLELMQARRDALAERTAAIDPADREKVLGNFDAETSKGMVSLNKALTQRANDATAMQMDETLRQLAATPATLVDPEKGIAAARQIIGQFGPATGKKSEQLMEQANKWAQNAYKNGVQYQHDAAVGSIPKLADLFNKLNATDDKGQFSYLPGMDNTEREAQIGKVRRDIDALKKAQEAEAKKNQSDDYRIAMANLEEAKRNHTLPDPRDIAVAGRGAQTGFQARAARNLIGTFDRQEWQTEAYAKNPYGFTVSADPNLTQTQRDALLKPISASNPDPQQVAARVAYSIKMGVPPVKPEEVSAIAALAKRDINKGLVAVNKLVGALPYDQQSQARAYISAEAGDKDAVFGNALHTYIADPKLGAEYVNGAKSSELLRKDKDANKALEGVKAEFDKRYRETGYANYKSDYTRDLQIVEGIAASRLLRGQKVDAEGMEQVLDRLVGKTVESVAPTSWGRDRYIKTIVPHGVNEDKVINWNRSDHTDLAKDYGVDAKTLNAPLAYTPLGYKLVRDGKYVKDKTGADILLDWRLFQ